jgi:hypothetical protein
MMIADTVHMYQVMYTFMYECGGTVHTHVSHVCSPFTEVYLWYMSCMHVMYYQVPGGATFMICVLPLPHIFIKKHKI